MNEIVELWRTKMTQIFKQHLEGLKEKGLYRSLRVIQGEQGPWVELEGKRVLNLSSNNYLGMASHPRLKEASARAIKSYGSGSGASRLICGTLELHDALEKRLAKFVKTEAALIFNSGYAANVGIISSVVGKGDVVFSDEFNHASIVDGCRLSRAEVVIFPHNDMTALEAKISSSFRRDPDRRRLVVVDGVFSVDGDLAPLPELVGFADTYDALLMVDEAHGTGTVGPAGRGALAHFGVEGKVHIIMGTLGKALGGFGAFAAGSRELIDYLINTSRSLIYSTALPPSVISSALAALDVLEETPSLVEKVQENARYMRESLKALGYDVLSSHTPILPVMIGEAALSTEFSQLLLKEGVLAVALRPPTVPEGTARIRVTVMATHTREDLAFSVGVFEKVGRRLGII
jgi:predicted pyridoxal phosphate-dependent acyltransferase